MSGTGQRVRTAEAGADDHVSKPVLGGESTARVRALLRESAGQAGKDVTREELHERVWGYEDIGDTRLLDVQAGRLRTQLERDPSARSRS